MCPDINPSIPVVGQPDASEEPKIVTALTQLVAAVNDVDSAQILDGTIAAADMAAQQAWQTVSISGTGITTTNANYFKDTLGIVRLRGDVIPNTGAIPDGTTIGTLPVGSRPVSTQFFTGLRSTGATFLLSVTAAGVITCVTGMAAAGAGSFYLPGIHFRAEN